MQAYLCNPRFPARYRLLVAIAAACFLAGCGSGGPPIEKTYPVKGKITLDGQPFGPARLSLQPKNTGSKDAAGEVDAAGNITVTTYNAGDGAPAGTFTAYIPPGGNNSGKPIPGVYESPTESPLRVTISEKGGDFTLELQSSAGPANEGQSTIPAGLDPSKMAMPSPGK